jgi:hypothetical protein
LEIGERVKLSSTFSENKGKGWCLGTTVDNRTGVVLSYDGGSDKAEQRKVVVYCEDAPDVKISVFKASWLERIQDFPIFEVGDYVQLNPATFIDDPEDPIVLGKCLGKWDDYMVGMVTAVGPIVDNIQRNVEVIVASKHISSRSSKKHVFERRSLYCASKLIKAKSYTICKKDKLLKFAEDAVRKEDGTLMLNAAALVEKLGLQVRILICCCFIT